MYVKEEVEEYLQKLEPAIELELKGYDEAKAILKEKIASVRDVLKCDYTIGTDAMDMAEAVAIMAGLNFVTLEKHREPLI